MQRLDGPDGKRSYMWMRSFLEMVCIRCHRQNSFPGLLQLAYHPREQSLAPVVVLQDLVSEKVGDFLQLAMVTAKNCCMENHAKHFQQAGSA
mmetsp:Transcript_156358/g.291804  ORF Transcript_156358/g.291804 Transcript_156358/m.291804 type:complete len:92 (+) Transcript_156358:148-423(+)